ncbi:MAG: hypothetical protein ACPG1A_12525, partial [Halioglobus sp.]
MQIPFAVAFVGLIVAVLVDRLAGTVIFCLAGVYVTAQYILIAWQSRAKGNSELAWNLGVAAVFAAGLLAAGLSIA